MKVDLSYSREFSRKLKFSPVVLKITFPSGFCSEYEYSTKTSYRLKCFWINAVQTGKCYGRPFLSVMKLGGKYFSS